MKRSTLYAALFAALCLVLSGCKDGPGTASTVSVDNPTAPSAGQPALEQPLEAVSRESKENSSASAESGGSQTSETSVQTGEIDRDGTLARALENAGVPEEDAENIKVERDRESDIPVFQVEFETRYGDYDFCVAIADGRIVDADYEVDEEWLDTLGGSPVTLEEAREIVRGRVPGSESADIQIWEESEDGRGRFEGELFHGGIQYEFEIDPQTGRIFDWNADLRE